MALIKTCVKCQETKPITHFYRKLNNYTSLCKPCLKIYNKKREEKLRQDANATRKCFRCKQVLPIVEFVFLNNDCRRCHAYYRRNKWTASIEFRIKEKERRKKFVKENKEWLKQYRKDNAEKFVMYEKNYDRKYPERRKEIRKRWAKQHPDKSLEQSNRRRARKRNAPVVEKIDRGAIIARDKSICHICQRKVAPKDMSLDHLIPLSKGGSHTAQNLAVAHLSCNSRRGPGRLPAQLRLM